MARLAFTIGITNDDEAVILRDHKSLLREHKSGLNDDSIKGAFNQVFVVETGGGSKRKTFSSPGRVNHLAALPLSQQKNKGAKADAAKAFTPGGKTEGAINPLAALPLRDQKDKQALASLDFHPGERGAATGKVNLEAGQTMAAQRGEEKPKRRVTRRTHGKKAAAKKTASGAKPSQSAPAADSNKPQDEGEFPGPTKVEV